MPRQIRAVVSRLSRARKYFFSQFPFRNSLGRSTDRETDREAETFQFQLRMDFPLYHAMFGHSHEGPRGMFPHLAVASRTQDQSNAPHVTRYLMIRLFDKGYPWSVLTGTGAAMRAKIIGDILHS